ncbi:Uncharacterised protein [Burkholderia multivorans]|nr:Uncharacterised protein [Burkholderia multivorans]
MDRGCFDDDSPTLTVQAHGDSTVHTTRISATKSAPRQIDRLALTIKIHSDSSRSGTHLSTWINGSSTMTRRHSALGLPAIRSTTRCPSTQQKPRLGESLCGAHHRNSQQLESLPCSPIHMNKRQFDDDSRALSAPVPCGSIVHAMPVSTTKSALRRIGRLTLTIEIHSDSSLFAVDISTSLSPYGRIRSSALAIQVRNASSLSVTDVSTTENPASPGQPPRTHRRNSQRSECLCRRPIHIPNRASMDR